MYTANVPVLTWPGGRQPPALVDGTSLGMRFDVIGATAMRRSPACLSPRVGHDGFADPCLPVSGTVIVG